MQDRILVIRFGSLGDVILTSATVVNLKLAFPGHNLTFLTKERFRAVVAMMPGVDDIVTVTDHAGPAELFTSMLEIDRRSFDIVIDLHGNPRSWMARSLVTSNQKVVYPKERFARWSVTRRNKQLPDRYRHTIDLYNDTLLQLGKAVPCRRPRLSPPLLDDENRKYLGQTNPRVLIAPGAAHANKAWPVERFSELAQVLYQENGAHIIWAVSSSDDQVVSDKCPLNGPNRQLLIDCPVEQLAAIACEPSAN